MQIYLEKRIRNVKGYKILKNPVDMNVLNSYKKSEKEMKRY